MPNFLSWLAALFYAVSAVYFYLIFFLKKDKTHTLAFLFLLLGLVTHGLDILVFGLDHHRFPASNFVEAFSLLTCLTILLFSIFVRKKDRPASGIFLIPITILSSILTALFRSDHHLDPVLEGGWANIHVPLMILSVASLAISFLMAVFYLLQERQLKSKKPAFFYYRLPSLEICEELSYRSLWIGFFLLTIGIVTGMIWSKHLLGVYWNWDPKETWSFISWGLYAILIHGRLLSAWRGRKAAYLSIAGFVLILFAFAGASLVSKGYHTF